MFITKYVLTYLCERKPPTFGESLGNFVHLRYIYAHALLVFNEHCTPLRKKSVATEAKDMYVKSIRHDGLSLSVTAQQNRGLEYVSY